MEIFPKTDVTIESSINTDAIVTVEGTKTPEYKAVKILFSKGILFSAQRGKARRNSPLPYLRDGKPVPENLRYVVLPKGVTPGLKLWGRIDFLVNHKGYILKDERKGK